MKSMMMPSASFLAPLLLLNKQAIGFAPISQLPQQHDRIIISSMSVVKTDQQEQIDVKTAGADILDEATKELDPLCNIEGSFCSDLEMDPLSDMQTLEEDTTTASTGWSYGEFAKTYPNVNNIGIATVKTATADLIAQTLIAQTPVSEVDWQRVFLFCLFGATYLGAFQYWYQVNIFTKLFDVDKFTSQPWGDKLKDAEGLKSLAAQTAVDLTVLTLIYLPTFYIFKAGVFSGSTDPSVWLSTGLNNYSTNFAKDEFDLIRVWAPADLVCFSVPLYLRLPVRHIVSFVWTAYLSFARGGH